MRAASPLPSGAAVAPERPTRVRYRVAALLLLLAMITYLDRICIATLAPELMREFGLTKVQMGYVFSAFALAYAVFEIPTARYADRVGTRVVLARIVAWWSAFTMLTGAAFNFVSLVSARFLFGAGEAGAWPSAARTFARWVPLRERGTLQGLFFSAAFLSGAATPVLVTTLLRGMSWRLVFVLFGLVGLAWVIVWQRWFRSEPAEHPEVNAAELDLILRERRAASEHPSGLAFWRRLLLHHNVVAVSLMYFPNSFVFYFTITWLPTYLRERHGFDSGALDFFTGLPLLLSAVAVVIGGVAVDRLTVRWGEKIGRCRLGAVAYGVAAFALVLTPSASSPILAASLIALAMAANTFTLSAAWGTCLDVGGEHCCVVSATMNTASQIGSLLCPLIVAYTLQWFGNWDVALYLMGALFAGGVACWCAIDPARRLES